MATASKILIRLQKFSSKISTVVDATQSFNANNNFYQDLSGWDSAVVQAVGLTGTINFSTTNDDGAITGQLLPAPEVPINLVSVLGVNLTTKTDVSSISADGIVEFGIIGKYLLLQGSEPATDYYYLNNEGFTIPPSAACASTTGMFNVQFLGEGLGFCDTPIDDVLFTSDTVLPAGDYWAFNNVSNTVRRFESTGTQPYTLLGVCLSPC